MGETVCLRRTRPISEGLESPARVCGSPRRADEQRAQRFALGTSDFLRLREAGLRYVDKSAFITEILRSEAHVINDNYSCRLSDNYSCR